jgi:hypothetical protein
VNLKMRPRIRRAVLGSVVCASTFAADFANYSGHPEVYRLMLFVLAGALAAGVVLLAAEPVKKILSLSTFVDKLDHQAGTMRVVRPILVSARRMPSLR